MVISSYFSVVTDFRVVNRCSHVLSDILGLVLVGVLADCDDFSEIFDYGTQNISFLRSDLGFIFGNGIPSEDTLERVFKHLKTNELEKCYQAFLGDLSLANKQICIDGKELRSTIPSGHKHALVRMVNAWVVESGLSFGQYQVGEKSNRCGDPQIVAIPALLSQLDCKNAVVSIDAIACQKNIISQIREQQADYVISLKGNQGELHQQVSQEFALELSHLPCYEQTQRQGGRTETRKVIVCSQPKWIENQALWKDLNSVVMVERTRLIKGEEQIHKAFYISSLVNPTAEKMSQYIRNHWTIENNLHWQLDITFGEDDAKVRNQNALINLHQVRKWALLILKKLPEKISIKRKRKKAHKDNEYLKKLLT
jgi:predicted transposase YbfD/YdcC